MTQEQAREFLDAYDAARQRHAEHGRVIDADLAVTTIQAADAMLAAVLTQHRALRQIRSASSQMTTGGAV